MIAEQKVVDLETGFMDEALVLAREIVTLRDRLASLKREHAELLEQREECLREGRDVLPRIRELFIEIESLPIEVARIQERIHWIINRGVEKLNSENNHTAAQHYMECRDNLRPALERVREAIASALRDMQAGVDLGPSLTDRHNLKLAEIEGILRCAPFSRVEYRVTPLPSLNAELVGRNLLLIAFDNWIGGLR